MIALQAENFSRRGRAYLSPFGKGAREAGYIYEGGKPDDITVLVAEVNLANK